MSQTWKTIRIFISSTFRDMHAERDCLVRFVFPELRERCARRQLHLVDVDLRWGVTEEEVEHGKVLEICLDEIEHCRPFFIGLLGERYGWVPPSYDVLDEPRYDWVRKFEPGHSITAMEIYAGVLRNPTMAMRAFFYFRDPAFISSVPEEHQYSFLSESSVASERLRRLKDDIRQHCPVFENYPCAYGGIDEDGKVMLTGLEAFGQRVLEDLWSAISQEYPEEVTPPDELAVERAYHETFVEGRCRRFVGRRDLLAQIAAYADGDAAAPLVVVGAPGCGKSALLANFTRAYAEAHENVLVLPHFIGVSPGSADIRRTLLRLCRELARRFVITDEIPEEYRELRMAFPKFLEQAAARGKVVLLLDALNHLDETHQAHTLNWLPQTLPLGLRLIVSTQQGDCLDALHRRRPVPPETTVGPLTPEDCKEIVRQTLWDYRKRLDEGPERDQMALLLSKGESDNPLYLIVACEELRVFGESEQVTVRIASLAEDVPALFEQVLERLKRDHGQELVRSALSLLACAWHGLLETEMLELLWRKGEEQLPRAIWARLYRSLQPYLLPAGEAGEGVLGFFHDQLAQAVQQQYLASAEEQTTGHRRLSEYFRHKADPTLDATWTGNYPRGMSELPYHLLKSHDMDGLSELVRTGFIQRQAESIGGAEALASAESIAVALSKAGERYWNDLTHHAYAYCTLTEQLREVTDLLEVFAQRGDISRLLAHIGMEEDPAHKGVLELAASVLLAEAGKVNEAGQLRERAITTIRSLGGPPLTTATRRTAEFLEAQTDRGQLPPSVTQRLGRMRTLSRSLPTGQVLSKELCYLVRALLTEEEALLAALEKQEDIKKEERREELPPSALLPDQPPYFNPNRTSPRKAVPIGYVICALLGSDHWIVRRLFNALLLAVVVLASVRTDLPFLGILLVSVLGLFLLRVGLLHGSKALLRAKSQSIGKLMAGLESAFMQATAHSKQIMLERVVRFERILNRAVEEQAWPAPAARMIAQALRDCDGPSETAKLISEAANMGKETCRAAATELPQLDKAWLRDAAAVLAMQSKPPPIDIGLCVELLEAIDEDTPPAILSKLLALCQETGDSVRLVSVLRRKPPSYLARSLLASLKGQMPGTTRVTGKSVLGLARQLRLPTPLSPFEPLLWAAIGIPALLIFPIALFLVLGLSLVTTAVIGSVILVSQAYDFARLGDIPFEGRLGPYCRRIGRRIQARPGVLASWVEARRVQSALVAREIVQTGRLESPEYTVSLPLWITCVAVTLLRQGLLGTPAEAIVKFMNKRDLLDAAVKGLQETRSKASVRQLGANAHLEQLQRVLPLASPQRHLMLVVIVSLFGTLLWLGTSGMIGWPAVANYLRPGMILGLLAFCIYLATLQCLFRNRVPGCIALAILFVGVPVPVFLVSKESTSAGLWIAAALMQSLFLTNLLVPEFIAHWRGTNLLYPTNAQLFRQRLLWICLFVGGCLLLGLCLFVSPLASLLAPPIVTFAWYLLSIFDLRSLAPVVRSSLRNA